MPLKRMLLMNGKPMLSVELRALLERLLSHDFAEECQECGIGYSDAWGELSALLDNPVLESQYEGMTQDQAQAVSDGVDEILHGKPAAQHHGELYAMPAPLKIGSGVTVKNVGFGPEEDRKAYLVFGSDGGLTEVNLIDVSLVSKRQVHTIADLEAVGVRVEQPATVADHPQCEECKGWGYHENHHEGGGTECGECGGSGNATVAVAVVMPERKTKADYSGYIEQFQSEAVALYNEALDDVARLNGVKP